MKKAISPKITPVLLMVSGGSDSMALLRLAAAAAAADRDASAGIPDCAEPLKQAVVASMGDSSCKPRLKCLHVNHMLRGQQADEDEAFVVRCCNELGVAVEVRRIDIAGMLQAGCEGGLEALAREQRYGAANEVLDAWCLELGVPCEEGVILTAHTLDDRVETFLMRAMVGTGPGGLASIPRRRGRVIRPLLDAGREQLRDILRSWQPGTPAARLWRDDPTNDDGSNFRSRVRCRLMPVMRQLEPGFEKNLARTMDLIAAEEESASARSQALVYRALEWDGSRARLPLGALASLDEPMARRVIRQSLLVVDPDARLESGQIARVLGMALHGEPSATEVDSGIRVCLEENALVAFKAR